jgi:hypothetical protein
VFVAAAESVTLSGGGDALGSCEDAEAAGAGEPALLAAGGADLSDSATGNAGRGSEGKGMSGGGTAMGFGCFARERPLGLGTGSGGGGAIGPRLAGVGAGGLAADLARATFPGRCITVL